jgi:hypothetical protein
MGTTADCINCCKTKNDLADYDPSSFSDANSRQGFRASGGANTRNQIYNQRVTTGDQEFMPLHEYSLASVIYL